MLLVPTYLKSSEIDGLGVFAAEPIKAGTKIWELREGFDLFIHEKDLDSFPSITQHFLRKYTYPHPTMEGILILGVDNDRFMNHNPTPNTDFKHSDAGYAVRDISKDEEITSNYDEFFPKGFTFVA